MKYKNLHCVKKKIIKKKKDVSLPLTTKTFYFLCFLLLCNAVIRDKGIKVVQFKRKFHCIIRGREFFTTTKETKKKYR